MIRWILAIFMVDRWARHLQTQMATLEFTYWYLQFMLTLLIVIAAIKGYCTLDDVTYHGTPGLDSYWYVVLSPRVYCLLTPMLAAGLRRRAGHHGSCRLYASKSEHGSMPSSYPYVHGDYHYFIFMFIMFGRHSLWDSWWIIMCRAMFRHYLFLLFIWDMMYAQV